MKNLTRDMLIKYLGSERLDLNNTVIDKTLNELQSAIPAWFALIDESFLTQALKDDYKELLEKRIQMLAL